MRKYAGKIMRWTLTSLFILFLVMVCVMPTYRAMATPAITSSIVDDWAAVAEGAIASSTAWDISGNYKQAVHIQAFLDADAQAHEGTEFIIQLSGSSSGNEDWSDMTSFVAMVDTPNVQTLNGDHAAGVSIIALADTGGNYEDVDTRANKWFAIEDSAAAAANELVYRSGFTTDTNITTLDATTNSHLSASNMYDVAMSRTITIPFGSGYRARVVCNNAYDDDGTASTLVWKVGKTITTDMEE